MGIGDRQRLAAKRKASQQEIIEKIRKLRGRRRKGQTRDCISCPMDRSFERIFQYLENASSALRDLNSSESNYMSSSSISDTVALEFGNHSRSYSISSESDSVELTAKVPCSATDSRKVTPKTLLQVMDSMGTIPDSHSEVTDSVELTPKVPCSATDNRERSLRWHCFRS
ncbi:hypothetical protein APTSU1_001116700 [Apodemus speciosus]|uniref:Uncharacterized protein n=1 Tax=Apodemus speciosus TaxID=105296 RepID=A0ABQ0F9I8_APOSI